VRNGLAGRTGFSRQRTVSDGASHFRLGRPLQPPRSSTPVWTPRRIAPRRPVITIFKRLAASDGSGVSSTQPFSGQSPQTTVFSETSRCFGAGERLDLDDRLEERSRFGLLCRQSVDSRAPDVRDSSPHAVIAKAIISELGPKTLERESSPIKASRGHQRVSVIRFSGKRVGIVGRNQTIVETRQPQTESDFAARI
jgi:hypothetical protein